MSNPQQVTSKPASRALRIVSPTYIATAFLLVFLVIALVVGSFIVRVPLVVEGQGMLMADNEVVNYAIQPESEGRLEEFFVKVGSRVSKGMVIARVSIPRLESEIVVDARVWPDRLTLACRL